MLKDKTKAVTNQLDNFQTLSLTDADKTKVYSRNNYKSQKQMICIQRFFKPKEPSSDKSQSLKSFGSMTSNT